MIPGLTEFGIAIAAHLVTDAGKAAARSAFEYLRSTRPDLESRAKNAQVSGNFAEIEKIFQEGVGVIVAAAASGKISVDQATLTALRGVKFDHQHGIIEINNTKIRAQVLITGGSDNATGQTHIGGNTVMASQGTSINVGHGASIVMTGGAKIIQN